MADPLNPEGSNALQMAIKSSSALKTDVMEAFGKLATGLGSSSPAEGVTKESGFFVEMQKSFVGICQHMR